MGHFFDLKRALYFALGDPVGDPKVLAGGQSTRSHMSFGTRQQANNAVRNTVCRSLLPTEHLYEGMPGRGHSESYDAFGPEVANLDPELGVELLRDPRGSRNKEQVWR